MRTGIKKSLVAGLSLILLMTTGLTCAQKKDTLMMATTTSTDNTGLLDYLKPFFEKETGIELKWVAVGTGKALELGKNCDVDVLLVHAPAAEKKYVEEGYGVDRRQVMYNDFVIVGPAGDPAGLKGRTIIEAMKIIAKKKVLFASRGDDSGTHKAELKLWKNAGITVPDREQWYIQTGQGMINTINIAAERGAYTYTDRGTYYKYESGQKGKPALVIILEGDTALLNQYSVIAVNPSRCSGVKYDLAKKFSEWMASPSAQKLIGDFKVEGKCLFTPNAGE
jgi:tungstate transport system substrate-binding protein